MALVTGANMVAPQPNATTLTHLLCAIDKTPTLAWSQWGSTSSLTAPAFLPHSLAQSAHHNNFTLFAVYNPDSSITLADFALAPSTWLTGTFYMRCNNHIPSSHLGHLPTQAQPYYHTWTPPYSRRRHPGSLHLLHFCHWLHLAYMAGTLLCPQPRCLLTLLPWSHPTPLPLHTALPHQSCGSQRGSGPRSRGGKCHSCHRPDAGHIGTWGPLLSTIW